MPKRKREEKFSAMTDYSSGCGSKRRYFLAAIRDYPPGCGRGSREATTDFLPSIRDYPRGCHIHHLATRRRRRRRMRLRKPFTLSSSNPEAPALFFLPHERKKNKTLCHLLNFQEKRLIRFTNMAKAYNDSCCIGSSHGFLVFMDESAAPFLLNPFTDARIQLPSAASFLNILSIQKHGDEFDVQYSFKKDTASSHWYSPAITTKQLRESFINKAILSASPLCPYVNYNYQVALIYGFESKLAYWQCRDESWTELDGRHAPYQDIIFNQQQLCALGDGGFLEVWDFNRNGTPPLKIMEIKPSFEEKRMNAENYWKELYTTRAYLVESCGDILMVLRHVGEFVNEAGQAVLEVDLLSDEDTQPLVCPYKTLDFSVYKLDLEQNLWAEIETLGNQTVFVGGNHSFAISDGRFSRFKEDAIYFTDDYWVRMNEDSMYGGHDMGVYSLREKRIKPFCDTGSNRTYPAPTWIVPDLYQLPF